MDNNPLTPNKIQKFLSFAQKSFNLNKNGTNPRSYDNMTSSTNYESSGILDLDKYEALGESGFGCMSLSKSSSFLPAEITGRSTEADRSGTTNSQASQSYGRHSVNVEDITNQMNKQSEMINAIMSQSVVTNCSFSSKRDLTADEQSFRKDRAPIPVNASQIKDITNLDINMSEMSMGAYFQNRCTNLTVLLPGDASPAYDDSSLGLNMTQDKALERSISQHIPTSNPYHMDTTLDSIPVKQPKKIPKMADLSMGLEQVYVSKENIRPVQSTVKPEPKFKHPDMFADPSKQHLSQLAPEDSLKVDENSINISAIADYLAGQESIPCVSGLFKQRDRFPRSQKEVNMNGQAKQDVQVTKLADTKKSDTASSASTINTVVEFSSLKPVNVNQKPTVVVSQYASPKNELFETGNDKRDTRSRSKSPSSKSCSTMSTVQENHCSFKSSQSPVLNKGGANVSTPQSPNTQYKELDRSVNWQELLQQKLNNSDSMAKENLFTVRAKHVEGYVGISSALKFKITSNTENWLSAEITYKSTDETKGLNIELPRSRALISPKGTEEETVFITSKEEINANVVFNVIVIDGTAELDVKKEVYINVKFSTPDLTLLSDKTVVEFPPVKEGALAFKAFGLLSNCQEDLQLKLIIDKGYNYFSIVKVQMVKDVDSLKQDAFSVVPNSKSKGLPTQLCKLTKGHGIKVELKFTAPTSSKTPLPSEYHGCLQVVMYNMSAPLKKINLSASIGKSCLKLDLEKLQLNKDMKRVILTNTGNVTGTWNVICDYPFRVFPESVRIEAEASIDVAVEHMEPTEEFNESQIIFEETVTKERTILHVSGGKEKQKVFPIKCNRNILSWIRPGRKELSLVNSSDSKIRLKIRMSGEGFFLETAHGTRCFNKANMFIAFAPKERKIVPVYFEPRSTNPMDATLHMALESEQESSRKVFLYGCSGGDGLRWSGQVTYGETALVRACSRQPVQLTLINKSNSPVFLAARVNFNLQYKSLESLARLEGAPRVVSARGSVSLTLHVPWAQAERRAREAPGAAAALATVTVLTGAEATRRRILNIFKKSSGGLDIATLPSHLQPLAEKFQDEDPTFDTLLTKFNETQASLEELVAGIQEMSAQIDLAEDFPDDTTILITDDSVVEHYTLCDTTM